MAIAVTSTKNTLAAAYGAAGSWCSLHTASPGSTGASEATGGGYARQQTTWGSPSNGTITGSAVTNPVAAGTYTHWGRWSAQTGGTFIDGGALSAAITLDATGAIVQNPSYTQS